MRHDTYTCNQGCPVEATLEVIGGKWKGVILYHLLERPYRFGELKRTMPGITQHMLTKQLRELEADGIVHRKVFREIPPKVEYSVTEAGESLREIVLLMRNWGKRHLQFSSSTKC
jgi:DNA-binding HxlR family transcriptional regulator